MWWMAAERAEVLQEQQASFQNGDYTATCYNISKCIATCYHISICIATCYYIIAATNTSSLPITHYSTKVLGGKKVGSYCPEC